MARSVIITGLAFFLFTTSGRILAENEADMDYGPFLTGSLDKDKAASEAHKEESREQLGLKHTNALAAKAINVRLGDDAAIAFDTDLLRYAAFWTGGFLDLDKTHLTSQKGSAALTPGGPILL